ncbi:MAG: hypothetical protein L6Q93_10750 [Phycisphaerae bacterium]|nr:hypothetical protein [Phycisphaerae bacterium]NUQ09529.1 hypothetical protein [Phycisphaerae bacterium]
MTTKLKKVTREVVERAQQAIGVSIRLLPDQLVYTSTSEVGRSLLQPESEEVVLRYNPLFPSPDYAVAHQAIHIQRFLGTSEARYLIQTTKATRARAFGSMGLELQQVSPVLADLWRNAFPILLDGLLRELVNLPADPWIHRRLLLEHPRLQPEVRKGVRAVFGRAREALRSDLANATPPLVYRASNAMKAASAYDLAEFLDEPALAEPYERAGFPKLASTLNELNATDRGASGDRETADAWARELDLVGWYEWRTVAR